ncbi:MAG TPA: OmpA family protein [Allosphingosinicella sp.]|jgi:outer membrane protein OmpA-like peptidoglycan-associated protein
MRKLGLTLLICGAASIPAVAWSQDAPQSAQDYVCQLTGECADQPAEATPEATEPGNARITATRGFALSRPAPRSNTPAATPRAAPRANSRNSVRPVANARPRAATPAGPGQRINLRLAFESGSARLTPAAEAQARVFAQSLQLPQLVSMRFRIEGHTDSVGNRARNLELSQRRAQTVADILFNAGVARNRIEVRGYGQDRPIPGTRASASENRRVEAVRTS